MEIKTYWNLSGTSDFNNKGFISDYKKSLEFMNWKCTWIINNYINGNNILNRNIYWKYCIEIF